MSLECRGRVALALAGGGPAGAVWEIGALRALEEAIEGLDLNDLCAYVGVSSGAFLSACLANGLTTAQLCRAIVKPEPGEHPFSPEVFFTPDLDALARGIARLPALSAEAARAFLAGPGGSAFLEAWGRLVRALPVGLLRNRPIARYLREIFSRPGRTDDFRRLERRLVVVATDLDAARAVRFGEPGYDHVPISTAVQASTALPGVYPPVEIDGRHYVDGVLLKTLHASVALEAGAGLVLCLNPLVPVDTFHAVEQGVLPDPHLARRGLPAVLAQTFRTLIHSRVVAGLREYEHRYPGRDLVLLEPRRDDYRMFFLNVFSFQARRDVCDHAYRSVRAQLLARRRELAPILARHGLELDLAVLEDRERSVWKSVGLADRAGRPAGVTERLADALERLEAAVTGAE